MPYDIIRVALPAECFGPRNAAPINSIVVHCVGLLELTEVFKVFRDYRVSAHYLVPQMFAETFVAMMANQSEWKVELTQSLRYPKLPPVIELVSEVYKANHAGASEFAHFNSHSECTKGLSAVSIGIEFHAPGYAKGNGSDWYHFTPYTKEQREVGVELIRHLQDKYNIPSQNLLAHSTIAPQRKTDPGPLFFWEELHEAGFGYLPPYHNDSTVVEPSKEVVKSIQVRLKAIGFNACPQNSELDKATQDHINVYIMQFASHLWLGKETKITQGLLNSLASFDVTMFAKDPYIGNDHDEL